MIPFSFKGAEVLITGGTAGIGRALASDLLALGAKVLVTGRDEGKISSLRTELPGVQAIKSDLSKPDTREALAKAVVRDLPGLNVVIQNGGFQRRVPLAEDVAPWSDRQEEIDALLSAPVHLNHLLIPRLLASGKPSLIVNVTSGGAFSPQPFAPLYSACKAALHSYTINLRFALDGTACRVVEVIPPAVATGLGGTSLGHGASVNEFVAAVVQELCSGNHDEIGYGPTESPLVQDFRSAGRVLFDANSSRFNVVKYADVRT